MTAKVNAWAVPVLAAIALIIAGILGATSHAVPEQLWTVIYILVGATAGVTIPTLTTSASAPVAPVPAPAQAATPVATP